MKYAPHSVAIIACLLAGCALGPDYEKPSTSIEQQAWQTNFDNLESSQSIASSSWKVLYDDPELQRLIQKALDNNLDLKIAFETLYRARNAVVVQDAALLPNVEAEFFHDKEKLSQAFSGNENIVNDFRLLGRVSWEIDLWGKLRRQSEASLANYQASEADYYGTRISLIADVAQTYYDIQNTMAQVALTQSNIEAREKSKHIAELRRKQGVISGLDVSQTHVELVTEKLKLPALNNQLKSQQYQLAILIGELPSAIDVKSRAIELDLHRKNVPVGLPADLLKRRPDIVSQERQLQAATANIGVAQANYFPNMTLSGYYGGKSAELSSLLDSADTWLIGVDVSMPLFTWGKTTAQVKDYESQYREALLSYRKTVLNAFRESAEALELYEQSLTEYELQQELLLATQENMRISQLRYNNGSVAYINVLDAQRSLASAQQDFSSAINNHQKAFIRLYKVLGGGWDAESFQQRISTTQQDAGDDDDKSTNDAIEVIRQQEANQQETIDASTHNKADVKSGND